MHALAAGHCTGVENLGFFCVSDSWWCFFSQRRWRCTVHGQNNGEGTRNPPILQKKNPNINPSFTEKYIQLTVSIFCFAMWKEEQLFQFSPDSAALLARAVIMPDLINEALPDLAGIWRGDLGKRQVLEEVAGLIHILAAFPLNQQENN